MYIYIYIYIHGLKKSVRTWWLQYRNQVHRDLLITLYLCVYTHTLLPGADKSLARAGRKQFRKHVRDVRDFSNIETRVVIKFVFLQRKAPKEIHAILTETLVCFLPGLAKDLPVPLYICIYLSHATCLQETFKELILTFYVLLVYLCTISKLK